MATYKPALHDFIATLAGTLREIPVAEDAIALLQHPGNWPEVHQTLTPADPAITSFVVDTFASLPVALTEGGSAGYAAPDVSTRSQWRTHAGTLPWRRPGFGVLPDSIACRLAVVELVGPAGMVVFDHCRIGLLLQSVQTHYPAHQHAAEEWYRILCGTAHWGSPGEPLEARAPGSTVHHTSWTPHVMQTHDEAMLAIWVWSGDIDGSHYRLLP